MVSIQERQASRVIHNRPKSDARFIGDLMGCYIFSDQQREDSAVKVFACRARSISTQMAVFDAPVSGKAGTHLAMRFDPLGLLHGEIDHEIAGGFVVRFHCTPQERETLAARIDWLKHYVAHQAPERRQYKRVLPRHPHASVMMAGGETVPCLIIDMSRSGVAVSADIAPAITTPLAIGSVSGRVVRYLDYGFAVEFNELQDLEKVEALLTTRTGQARRPAPAVPGLHRATTVQ